MTLLTAALRAAYASPRVRQWAHRRFMRACASLPTARQGLGKPLRVLLLGVYLTDLPNTASHLVRAFASGPELDVEQRWVALGGTPVDPELQRVTVLVAHQPTPKFALMNQLIGGLDLEQFDYVIVTDDDIHVRVGFLRAMLAWQRKFGFSLAQPARAWHSHFDHAFVLCRPWLAARQTRFVECGPLVSFSRDAVRLLLPFDAESQMWGMDLIWPLAIERAGLAMGIIDAVQVDHSLRGQATTYDRSKELAAMSEFLAKAPHLSASEIFKVLRRFPAHWRKRYF